MTFINDEKINRSVEAGEALYKSIGNIYCPYFREKIAFNSQGLDHLKYKERDKKRHIRDQFVRFKLIRFASEIISKSHTLQGIFETNKFENIRISNRTDIILVAITYYEFIAVINKNRIKIIIKQIKDGEKFFWSIIPFGMIRIDQGN